MNTKAITETVTITPIEIHHVDGENGSSGVGNSTGVGNVKGGVGNQGTGNVPPPPEDGTSGGGSDEDPNSLATDPRTLLTTGGYELQASGSRLTAAYDKLRAEGTSPMDALMQVFGPLGGAKDLAELMIEFAVMGRENAMEQRLAARNTAAAEMQAQADTMRASAVTQLVTAVISTALTVAAAVPTLSNATKGLKSMKGAGSDFADSTKAAEAAPEALSDTGQQTANTAAQLQTTQQQIRNTRAAAQGQIFESAAKLVDAIGGFVSKWLDAEGMEHGARAEMAKSSKEHATKLMDDFDTLLRSIIQFIDELARTENELQQNFLRG